MKEEITEKKTTPRNRRPWLPNEVKRVKLLLANGYEKEEVCKYLGRSQSSLNNLLSDLETTVAMLRQLRGLSRAQMLEREPLGEYRSDIVNTDITAEFPHLTLLPPAQYLGDSTVVTIHGADSIVDAIRVDESKPEASDVA